MKEFIKDLKMKELKASELAYLIEENQKHLIDFYIKEGHRVKNADVINKLYDKMIHPKFVKAMKKIVDDKHGEGLDTGFVVIINNFIERYYKNDEMTEELIQSYSKIMNKILKDRTKEVAKKTDLDKDIIRELLVIVPDVGYISNERFVGVYSQKMLRKLYIIAKDKEIGLDKTKDITKLFKVLFGKKMLDLIAVNVLLEKKEYTKNLNENSLAIWNLFTNFALEVIEKEDKKHIVELLEYYCERRKTDANNKNGSRDGARRIQLSNVDSEKYPNIAKAIQKLNKNGKKNLTEYL